MRKKNRKVEVPVATIDKHAVPSLIAWQWGNGEAESEKVRFHEDKSHINLTLRNSGSQDGYKGRGPAKVKKFACFPVLL